jgi:hypothetical protein
MYGYISNNCDHRHSNKSFKEKFEAKAGKHSVDRLQQTVVPGTTHIMRKVLQSVKLEAWVLGIDFGAGELPGRNGV